MLTVGISMQLQGGPLMRDHNKGATSQIYDSFHFFFWLTQHPPAFLHTTYRSKGFIGQREETLQGRA